MHKGLRISETRDETLIAALRTKKSQMLNESATQFSCDWMRDRHWSAMPVPDSMNDMEAEWICEVAKNEGWAYCHALRLDESSPSAELYKVPFEQNALLAIDAEASIAPYLLLREGCEFAILLPGDYFYVIAGPADFVRKGIGCTFKTAKRMFLDRYADLARDPSEKSLLLDVWSLYEPFSTDEFPSGV